MPMREPIQLSRRTTPPRQTNSQKGFGSRLPRRSTTPRNPGVRFSPCFSRYFSDRFSARVFVAVPVVPVGGFWDVSGESLDVG